MVTSSAPSSYYGPLIHFGITCFTWPIYERWLFSTCFNEQLPFSFRQVLLHPARLDHTSQRSAGLWRWSAEISLTLRTTENEKKQHFLEHIWKCSSASWRRRASALQRVSRTVPAGPHRSIIFKIFSTSVCFLQHSHSTFLMKLHQQNHLQK